MKTVGERIRQAREFRRLSGEALAKEVGYTTQSGISNLENRALGRGGFKLPAIAKALDFSVEWFLNGPDVEDMTVVPPFATPAVYTLSPESLGRSSTTRQHAHHLVNQMSELGLDKAISMLELIVAAHPRRNENSAGLSLPAQVKPGRRRSAT